MPTRSRRSIRRPIFSSTTFISCRMSGARSGVNSARIVVISKSVARRRKPSTTRRNLDVWPPNCGRTVTSSSSPTRTSQQRRKRPCKRFFGHNRRCPKNLLHGLFLLCCEVLVGLEEDVTVLPQFGGQTSKFLRVVLGLRRLATLFEITTMRAEFTPDLAPDILQDMKVVELNMGLGIDRLDRVGIGLPMIDVKGRQIQSESLHPLQKGFNVFLIALFNFLRGDDPSVFIFEHNQATLCAERKEFIKMPLRDRLLSVE